MAKQITPFGGHFVGRLGTAVGAKMKGGEYVARSYQPQVKNPNTLRQQKARERFSVVSAAASMFAEIINIGYAAASNGTKMYPRNMFVKQYAPYGVEGILIQDGEVTYDFTALKFSRKAGIEVVPQGSYATATHKITFTNTGDVPLREGEKLGVVTLFVDNTAEYMAVVKGEASQGAELPADLLAQGIPFVAYSFYKIIEASATEVDASTWPWKYPSATGPQNGGISVTNA